ncbi:hypothetical protein L873DRAFT_1810830 [Choiromyces venosus 120613-1]|uniref:Uncharacterized protein n=1 Tax=Choiromyces venosus 120613-1 TaxID=1336337 RepID=A0A3N4JJ76_9PEZI|nr:hypothetical protein L873DRAFT_1810830 [Choiromyces venosus 120613-1]
MRSCQFGNQYQETPASSPLFLATPPAPATSRFAYFKDMKSRLRVAKRRAAMARADSRLHGDGFLHTRWAMAKGWVKVFI